MCSIRGENRARLIVTAPMAASTPMPEYQSKIAARAMTAFPPSIDPDPSRVAAVATFPPRSSRLLTLLACESRGLG